MNIKKLLSALFAIIMLVSLAACGAGTTEEQGQIPATEPLSDADQKPVADGDRILYFSLSTGENYDSISSLTAYENEDGSIHVEYVGEEKKVGNVDTAVLADLEAALEESGLLALDGQSEYADGQATGSLYVSYADDSFVAADYTGVIPQEFTAGFETMEAWFRTLTAEMPVYVPQAQVVGEVEAQALEAMQAILNASGMEGQDGLIISEIPRDEYFAFTAGLSSDEGISNGVTCTPMMNVTPYSLVIVTLQTEADAKNVRADFEISLDWGKWVCVAPTNALIAQKGNMVLCLMGSDAMYTQTEAAVNSCGWENVVSFDNPNL